MGVIACICSTCVSFLCVRHRFLLWASFCSAPGVCGGICQFVCNNPYVYIFSLVSVQDLHEQRHESIESHEKGRRECKNAFLAMDGRADGCPFPHNLRPSSFPSQDLN